MSAHKPHLSDHKHPAASQPRSPRVYRLLDELYTVTADAFTPESVAANAMSVLRDALQADGCAWLDVESGEDHFVVLGEAGASHVFPPHGGFAATAFGQAALQRLRAGQPFVCRNAIEDLPKGADRPAFLANTTNALIVTPVLRAGRLVGAAGVHMASPRDWTEEDVDIAKLVTKRCAEAITSLRAEAALRASEARYRAVVDNQTEMVSRFHPDGTLLFVNASYARAVGQAPEALIGANFWSFVPLDQQAQIRAALAAMTPEAPECQIENQFDAGLGPRWMLWTNRAIRFDPQGRVLEAQSVGIDITERKRAEDRLLDAEILQRLLLDSTVAFIGVLDPDGTLQLANAPALVAGGLTPEDVVGKKFWDCYWWSHDPDARGRLQESVARACAGEVVRYDAEVRMAGDSRMTIDFMLSAVRDEEGQVQFLVPSGFDITDRKRAEEQLRESEKRYRTLFTVIDQGFCIVDVDLTAPSGVDYRVVEANPAFFVQTGFPERIMGRWLREASPDLEEHWFETYGRVARTGAPERFESRSAALNRWFDVYAFRFDDSDARRVAILFSDISARKHHEQHTQLLLREVNHRAKNLLNLVQAIAKQTAVTTPEDFLGGFQRRIQALAANQDLLVKGEWTSVPMLDLVQSQLAHFEARVAVTGPPIAVNAQAAQTLTMALHELATNAAKYGALSTLEGRVEVSWSIGEQQGARRWFALSWIERGGPPVRVPKARGFGSTVIEKVVSASFQCDASLRFEPAGVQWRMQCAADRVLAGAGPVSSSVTDAPPAAEAAKDAPRILVVEDEPLIAFEIVDTLSAAGFTVVGPAFSLREGLALAGACDLALLDVNLGAETSERIAEALAQAGRPFIVVSGYEREQQPPALRGAPRVSKPVLAEALIAEVRRGLGQ